MSFYSDEHEQYFLLSFRSSKLINEDRIGGLFRTTKKNVKYISITSVYISCISIIFNMITIYLVRVGWPNDEFYQLIIGILAFAPAFLLIISIFIFTSAPVMIVVHEQTLHRSLDRASFNFHLASFFISLNITILFASISLFEEVENFQEFALILLVDIFWGVYLLWSLRNLICLKHK